MQKTKFNPGAAGSKPHSCNTNQKGKINNKERRQTGIRIFKFM